MPTSYNFADAQRLLIKPFERLGFVIIFVLTTGLSQVLTHFVSSQPAFDLLWERSQIQYGIATGIIAGMFIGASQWLILRKYVPDWKWILVVGLGTTFISSIQSALDMWKESILSSTHGLSGQGISPLIVAAVISIGAILISGYLEWYVLRPYVTNAWWWIFIRLIAVLPIGILLLLKFLTQGFLGFNWDVIKLTVLPTTQAIGFCILKKKSVSESTIPQSPLALAPDIVNYREIQRLEGKLYARISRIWATDMKTSIGQLSYLVGVSRNAVIITYEPVNQDSTDNVDQTPLTELGSNFNSAALKTEDLTGFAKFQVVFTPPSMVKISSCRGIPLILLGVTAYIGIIAISILFAWLRH